MGRIILATWAMMILLAPDTASADTSAGQAALERGDYVAAARELLPSAEANDPHAQFLLGKLYADGTGVPQDFVQAHLWYNLAAAHGNQEAVAARDALTARMPPAQLTEAQALARQRFAAAPPAPAAQPPRAEVAQAQRSLKALGHNPGRADGVMDDSTRLALQSYQSAAGMPATGELTPMVSERLRTAAARPSSHATAVDLKEVQRSLSRVGYDSGPPDGRLGARTKAAIRRYQKDRGLAVTGTVTPDLVAALEAQQPAGPGERALGQGGTLSSYVAAIQDELKQHGYDTGPATGSLTPGTREAIRRYQHDAGIAVTGEASQELLNHLKFDRPAIRAPQKADTE